MFKALQIKRSTRYFFVLFIAIATVFSARGQQKQKRTYTLLWRISGKDLKQPSYLFGTMHVKDKRVFNFSDSVMLAIQKCQSFALEVQPDSAMRLLFNIWGKNDTTLDLHKLLSEKEYAELAKRFEKRNGYKMRDDMSPLMAESMLSNDDYGKPDDKESFIDAYLYGIARTMNKTICGLENTSQQMNKMMGSPDAVKARLLYLLDSGAGEDREDMVNIYSSGNLDAISNYVDKYLVDSEMMARNKVMAGSIIRTMHEKTLFAAVGAAHLPGDNGVIALLRKEGYTVTAVPATFTGVWSKFHIDYKNMKWVTHTDYDMGYSLQFPAEPLETNIYGTSSWIFPDLANEVFYGIYVARQGTADHPADAQKAVNKIIHNLTKSKMSKLVSRKIFSAHGLTGTDIITKGKHGYQRSVLFINNNMLYYLYMGNRLTNLRTDYANRFFGSFNSFKTAEKPAKDWIVFKNDTAAFSVKLPFEPRFIGRDITSPKLPGKVFKIKMYLSTDTDHMMNYLLRYNDYPNGTFLADKDALFNSITTEFSGRAKIIGEPKKILKDGYMGREIKLEFSGNYRGLVRVYLRGNRLYMLMEQNLRDGAEIDANDIFFNSFMFDPYLKPEYINFESPGDKYTIKLPSRPADVADSVKTHNSYLNTQSYYVATSPVSGDVYGIEHTQISKYYRTTGTDSLYRELTKLTVKYTDSLIKVDTIDMNGKKALEVLTENKATKEQRRKRIIIDEGDVFVLQSFNAREQLFNDESNTFYSSFARTGPGTKIDLASSKSAGIAAGLRSGDTTTFLDAKGALGYYTFTRDELPDIYSAIKYSYPDDTSSYSARSILIEKLRDLHDSTTLSRLETLYGGLHDKDELKSTVLSIMPATDSIKGYDAYFKLFTSDRPVKANGYTIFRPLYDSLEYAAAHFQQIVPVMADSNYRKNILQLASDIAILDKESYTTILRNNFGVLTAEAMDEIKHYIANKDSNKYEYGTGTYSYLNIMKMVKGEPLTNTYTNYYITHLPKGVFLADAVTTRISNSLPVSQTLISRLLDSLGTRYEIMEAYYHKNQLSSVPLKYRAQSEFGRLCLYKEIESSDDDYGAPEKVTLLGSILDSGSVYYAYSFKSPDRESGTTFIGIAGPFKPGSAALNFKRYNAYTVYEAKKQNWIKQAKAMIPDLKASYDIK